MLKQITKKDFMSVHKDLRILGVDNNNSHVSAWNNALEYLRNNQVDIDSLVRTSRVDLGNQGKQTIVTCYQDDNIFLVETRVDNSLSRTSIRFHTIVYLLPCKQ